MTLEELPIGKRAAITAVGGYRGNEGHPHHREPDGTAAD